MLLKNTWHVAGRSGEIGDDLREIILLGENICMFRDSTGTIVALANSEDKGWTP